MRGKNGKYVFVRVPCREVVRRALVWEKTAYICGENDGEQGDVDFKYETRILARANLCRENEIYTGIVNIHLSLSKE